MEFPIWRELVTSYKVFGVREERDGSQEERRTDEHDSHSILTTSHRQKHQQCSFIVAKKQI